MLAPFKNLLFDFGGVLIDLDINKSFIELSTLLDLDPNEFQNLINDMMPFMKRYEKGEIGSETFIWNVQKLTNKKVDIKSLIEAWNAMLLGWNPAKLDFLSKICKVYPCYLLSNTNELHMEWVMKDLKASHNIIDFNQRYFVKTYYSYIIGMRKPDLEIYDFVARNAGIRPEDTLFLDDSLPNIEAAASLGYQVMHHECNASLDFLLPY